MLWTKVEKEPSAQTILDSSAARCAASPFISTAAVEEGFNPAYPSAPAIEKNGLPLQISSEAPPAR
jgi:hypothetical protein